MASLPRPIRSSTALCVPAFLSVHTASRQRHGRRAKDSRAHLGMGAGKMKVNLKIHGEALSKATSGNCHGAPAVHRLASAGFPT